MTPPADGGTSWLRWLRVVAVLEPLTLLVLVGNLATVHVAALAAALGPVHGTLYLAGIALAWAAALPRRSRLLAVVPAVGAWLATRAAAPADRPAT